MSCSPLLFTTLYELDGINGSHVVNGNEHIFTFDISNSITFSTTNCEDYNISYIANVLIVGGGGSGGEKSPPGFDPGGDPIGGGYNGGGGGGGGEVIYNTNLTILPNVPYSVIIGSGGSAVGGGLVGNNIPGNDGDACSILGYNANGGKGGGAATVSSAGIGGNSGGGPGYDGKGGDGGVTDLVSGEGTCSYSGNFGPLVNGIYYGGGGGGGSFYGQMDCGNTDDTAGNCFGRGGYGGEGGGGNAAFGVPVLCRTVTPISAADSIYGRPNSGGGGAGQNGNIDESNFSGAGGSGVVILYVYYIVSARNGCTWNQDLANQTTIWSRASGDCVDLSGATLPNGNPMTYDDLSEKRKAVIFQYKNNGAGFSKKQHYSRLARGIGRQRGQTFASQSETHTYSNTHNLVLDNSSVLLCPNVSRNWALTNQNDTPGPVRRITNYPTVPLTNYIVRRTYLAGGTKWPQYAWAPGMLGFPVGKKGNLG